MDRVFPAHIRMKDHRQTVQTVKAHNEAVARYAGERLLPLGLQKTGELAGLLHDMGKAKQEFADYLYAAVQNQDCVKRGSVNHTFAAVRFLLERHHPAGQLTPPALPQSCWPMQTAPTMVYLTVSMSSTKAGLITEKVRRISATRRRWKTTFHSAPIPKSWMNCLTGQRRRSRPFWKS